MQTSADKPKRAPIADRRYVFAQRRAAGLSLRASESGLGLNGARELKRADVQEMIQSTLSEKAEREERKKLPSMDAIAPPKPTPCCSFCGIVFGVETPRIPRGPYTLCQDCCPPSAPLSDMERPLGGRRRGAPVDPASLPMPEGNEPYTSRRQAYARGDDRPVLIPGDAVPSDGQILALLVGGAEANLIDTSTFSVERGHESHRDREALIERIKEQRRNAPAVAQGPKRIGDL